MPRVNIWLPEELHRQAKAEGLNVSAITRLALTRELARISRRHLSTQLPDTVGERHRRQ